MKKLLKLALKGLVGIIAILIIAFVALLFIYNEDVPEGRTDADADVLAYKMLDALHFERYLSVKQLHWTFRGKNTYKWSLKNNVVDVYWDNYHVIYHTKKRQNSIAYKDGAVIDGQEKEEAITYAINNFNNDSFWLIAPYKVFDKGTTRSIVKEGGKEKLLVQYSSGGSTPGDAYLWELGEDFKPVAFKMWVSILPFDGIEAKWSDWQMADGGFMLANEKTLFGLEIPITNVKVIP